MARVTQTTQQKIHTEKIKITSERDSNTYKRDWREYKNWYFHSKEAKKTYFIPFCFWWWSWS